jgi:hypothetical protein
MVAVMNGEGGEEGGWNRSELQGGLAMAGDGLSTGKNEKSGEGAFLLGITSKG